MNIGRRHNADPRWLLPLLCRRGHITRTEVGAIRIAASETRFAIPRAMATRFAEAVKRTAGDEGEGEVMIERAEGPPGPTDRGDRGAHARPQPRPAPRPGPPPRRTSQPSTRTRSAAPASARPNRPNAKPYRGKPKGPRTPR